MITFHDPKTFRTLWTFDLEGEEGYTSTFDWPEHPIESGSVVSDYGVDKPEVWTVGGYVTATPLGEAYDGARIETLDSQIRQLARKKQPLIAAAGFFIAEAVITSVNSRRGLGDPEHLPITVQLKQITIPTPTFVTMPRARIKPKKRKRNEKKKKGGKATGQTPTGPAAARRRSVLVKGGGLLGGLVG